MSSSVLVLENYRDTLTIVRSLSRAGYRIIIGNDGKKEFTEYSRFVSDHWHHPSFDNESDFVSALRTFLSSRRDISYIYPVGEISLKILARYFSEIPKHCKLIMADPSVVLRCLDKIHTYSLVQELGIPLKKTVTVKDLADLHAQAARIGFPCVVKPENSLVPFFSKKCIPIHDLRDLQTLIPEWPKKTESLIVQGLARGVRHNCMIASKSGEIRAFFVSKVLRTDVADGTGYGTECVSAVPDSRLRGYCESLLKKLDYTGISCIQFLVDKDQFHFLEINPRQDATCSLPYYCGYDFPLWALSLAAGQEIKTPSSYPVGKKSHWLLGDLRGIIRGIRRKQISFPHALRWIQRCVDSFFKADCHMTFTWKDPFPTMVMISSFFFPLLKKRLIPRVRCQSQPR